LVQWPAGVADLGQPGRGGRSLSAALTALEQIAFLPWAPIQDADGNPAVAEAAGQHAASSRQIVLAWLLARSPMMLPIPGTGSPEHAEANVAAAAIGLSPDEVAAITQAT
jgi:pyridoxine 4-dehydrogenase